MRLQAIVAAEAQQADGGTGDEALPPLQLSVNPQPPQPEAEERAVEPADAERAEALWVHLAACTHGLLLADLEARTAKNRSTSACHVLAQKTAQ